MTSKGRVRAYLQFIRPSNFVIAFASIFVACLLAGGTMAVLAPMVAAALAGGMIGAGGMVINDLFDIEIDRINKPDRPLPAGLISRKSALFVYALLSIIGIVLNFFTSTAALIIAVAAVPMIFAYSAFLKRTPLLGNLLVAFLTGLAFLYGGAAVGRIDATVMPAVLAFLINAGREVIKDMEDREGDALLGARTLPIVYGMRTASIVATILLAALIVATSIPFAIGMYGIRYYILVNAGVNAVLLYVLWQLWRDQSTASLHRLSVLLKYDMVVGLIAVFLG
jgi:geranylgeranylglycerol-phosphate geranylgeranyltransferase